MRVLLPLLDFPPTRGGIQTMMREFVTRTSFDVRVIAPADPGFEAVDPALPVAVVRVRGLGSSRRGFVPSVGLRTLSEAKSWKPDVVFAGHVMTAPAGVRLRSSYGIPLSIATYAVELLRPRIRGIARRVLPKADRILAVSRFTKDDAVALGASPGRTEVIPVGAPDPKPADAARINAFRTRFGLGDSKVLLTVARLEDHKGIDLVMDAMPDLPPDVRYVVVGSGSAGERLRAKANGRTVFTGPLDDADLVAAYNTASAFALASRDRAHKGVEGCPVALLEAAAYGLPILAGRTGGIEDAVTHNETGILVDPENAAELREGLKLIVNDRKAATRLARNAEAVAKTQRSWSSVVERIERLLEAAVRGAQREPQDR
jgi:phosphatidylinositol alpha-1,6-mannosyltransferase